MTLAEARDKALEARRMIPEEINPQLAKTEQNATFQFVAEQWKVTKLGRGGSKKKHFMVTGESWRCMLYSNNGMWIVQPTSHLKRVGLTVLKKTDKHFMELKTSC